MDCAGQLQELYAEDHTVLTKRVVWYVKRFPHHVTMDHVIGIQPGRQRGTFMLLVGAIDKPETTTVAANQTLYWVEPYSPEETERVARMLGLI